MKNYRPISLLCTISKVLEKIIYDKSISFVSQSISPLQFGFRPKHSTLQQLLLFVNSICESFSSMSQTDVIYLDFKKAFDSVAQNELLVKLWSFGITGNLWWWFRGYLSSRHQCVIVYLTHFLLSLVSRKEAGHFCFLMTFPLLFHLLTHFYLLMTHSASKLFAPLLTAVLCKMTYKFCFTGVNTGIYTSMKENASFSDFLPNVHIYPSITLSLTNL